MIPINLVLETNRVILRPLVEDDFDWPALKQTIFADIIVA